jgi:5'-3' exonuclease
MRVHLVDGTYELFRHFFGQPSRSAADGSEIGAARGVVLTVLSMLAQGDTYIGVATDHVIASFRNDLWPGYKTGEEIAPELLSQFGIVEVALRALGVVVWPMVELEADDALASAAAVAADDHSVEQVVICTPDKDLAQCVVGTRVVQLDRRANTVRDEAGVWSRFGVAPHSIPDWLALVGDSADGFPGLSGWGPKSASTVLAHYGSLAQIPDKVGDWDPELRRSMRGTDRLAETLARDRELANLFLDLATLRVEPSLLESAEALRWQGPADDFEEVCRHFRDASLADRARKLASRSR